MNTRIQPILEISRRARSLLVQDLGVVDTMRFFNQFHSGSGDYTKDREALFANDSVKSIVSSIKAMRSQDEN